MVKITKFLTESSKMVFSLPNSHPTATVKTTLSFEFHSVTLSRLRALAANKVITILSVLYLKVGGAIFSNSWGKETKWEKKRNLRGGIIFQISSKENCDYSENSQVVIALAFFSLMLNFSVLTFVPFSASHDKHPNNKNKRNIRTIV